MPDDQDMALNSVLVIGAHPDDPEFGCAATMAKWAAMGRQIHYVLLTSGDKGCSDPAMRPGQVTAMREREQRAAAQELGVQSVQFLRYPDGLLENNMALRQRLSGVIREIKPDILVAIDPWRRYQLHPDHRAAGLAALDALYAAREWYIFPEQLGDDPPWRVKEVYLFWTDEADYWEDVSEVIEQRVAALCHHQSQIRGRGEEVGERIRSWTREMGEAQGYAHAEAFKRIKL
ncbi:MAG: PIG-L deacetylase family protein [Anaerolineae bacterium]